MDEKLILQHQFNEKVAQFCDESNRIAGIEGKKEGKVLTQMTLKFLKLKQLTLKDVVCFANKLGGDLRNKKGMDFESDTPPKGGEFVVSWLTDIVGWCNDRGNPNQQHQIFNKTLPFTHENGRTSRTVWLWQMVNQHNYDVSLKFLQMYYKQDLHE
jgi:hypothetical protein